METAKPLTDLTDKPQEPLFSALMGLGFGVEGFRGLGFRGLGCRV